MPGREPLVRVARLPFFLFLFIIVVYFCGSVVAPTTPPQTRRPILVTIKIRGRWASRLARLFTTPSLAFGMVSPQSLRAVIDPPCVPSPTSARDLPGNWLDARVCRLVTILYIFFFFFELIATAKMASQTPRHAKHPGPGYFVNTSTYDYGSAVRIMVFSCAMLVGEMGNLTHHLVLSEGRRFRR